jgi:hypothetical protein
MLSNALKNLLIDILRRTRTKTTYFYKMCKKRNKINISKKEKHCLNLENDSKINGK